MASRAFTVFQDVPSPEAVKAKVATSNVMATRSSARLNNTPQGSSTLSEQAPVDKENVNPVTGERAGTTGSSKKRKPTVLTTKPTIPLAIKKVKLPKESKEPQPVSKKRKASSETTKSKSITKEVKGSGTSRKPTTKRSIRKVSKLPKLEEEAETKAQETGHSQATIDSRCYELTVQPLADVSPAYETIETTQDASASTVGKPKLRKDTSAEPELRDLFSSSPTLASQPSTTARAFSAEPIESRKFSTPERKQIYAAFTFSTPSPTSERFKSSSRSHSIPRLDLV